MHIRASIIQLKPLQNCSDSSELFCSNAIPKIRLFNFHKKLPDDH